MQCILWRIKWSERDKKSVD